MRLIRKAFVASRARALFLAFVLIGLSGLAAQAQVVTEFSTGVSAGSFPAGIAAGPDGNLWFAEQGSGGGGAGGGIGRITPLGVVTEFKAGATAGFSAGAQPWAITAGPDGNLWFTDINLSRIGRITPLGVVT
ncbi:MAG: hypothetical protein NEA02_11170, partial [Thermoanaerobaculia bacterium]|nr:hypothetical protein [Thermoanaerobaculia bacterium]